MKLITINKWAFRCCCYSALKKTNNVHYFYFIISTFRAFFFLCLFKRLSLCCCCSELGVCCCCDRDVDWCCFKKKNAFSGEKENCKASHQQPRSKCCCAHASRNEIQIFLLLPLAVVGWRSLQHSADAVLQGAP